MDRKVSLMMSTNSFRASCQCSRHSCAMTPAVAHPAPLPAARGHLRVVIKPPGRFMLEGDTVDDDDDDDDAKSPTQRPCILVFCWVL